MKTKVIATFPQYSGIFLNRESKIKLLKNKGLLAPRYNRKYCHHSTLNFAPGTTINVKWGAKVELQVVRHIFDDYCQLIEVVPVTMIFKDNRESVTVTDRDEIFNLLGIEPKRLYITISTKGQFEDGRKISYEYSKRLLEDGGTVEELHDDNLLLSGFCGVYVDSLVENYRRNK